MVLDQVQYPGGENVKCLAFLPELVVLLDKYMING